MRLKKSSIQLGLLTAAVRVEVAVETETSGAHAVCTGTTEEPHPPSRVRSHVDCKVCDRSESSAHGYPLRGIERDGELVVLSAEELTQAAGSPIKNIDLEFCDRADIFAHTVASNSVQNLYPDRGAERAYQAIRRGIQARPGKVGVVVWSPGSVNALWVVEVVEDRLVMSKRCWPEQVRVPQVIPDADLSEAEVDMVGQIIDAKTTPFDVTRFQDTARLGRAALIDGVSGTSAAPAAAATNAAELLATLQATLDASRPKPTKKAPAKKAAAKKPAAKRAPAKRTSKVA